MSDRTQVDRGRSASGDAGDLSDILDSAVDVLDRVRREQKTVLRAREVGRVMSVEKGIAEVSGLAGVESEELVRFAGGQIGLAFNLDPDVLGVVLFTKSETIRAGEEVYRTGRVMDVPVGEALLGRVVNPLGEPLDGKGRIATNERYPMERDAPGIMDRSPVEVPLQTGIMAIDAIIPIGRGQRELIFGDRQTGKTAVALDTMINQTGKGVRCIYCAVGKPVSAVSGVIEDLKRFDALSNTIVVMATGEDSAGLNFIAPYAATAMGEYFMDRGQDVLIVYDDLTRHARSYRELSLLLRRPPAREAYPGDIFYIHSRMLERSTHFSDEHGGGSMTALPIIETQAQNISAYIPTNLISITDGQIYMNPKLFQEAQLPAVDIGMSVSRVGGKTQLPAYRDIAGDLRLTYSQFEELESFARFGTRLEESTRKTLERGRRVRAALKQNQFDTIPVPEQIAVLLSVTEGLFDPVPLDQVADGKRKIREAVRDRLGDMNREIRDGKKLTDEEKRQILEIAGEAIHGSREQTGSDRKTGDRKTGDRDTEG